MNAFLSGLGGKLAERWLTLLVLPGVFYLAVATVAQTLGHAHALDAHQLTTNLTGWAKRPIASTVGGQMVLLAGILTAAGAMGLAAQALNHLTERLALAADWRAWPTPLCQIADCLTRRRREKWTAYRTRYQQLFDQALSEARADNRARARAQRYGRPVPAPANRERLRLERHASHRAWSRISLEEPDRPTWSGDCIHAVSTALRRDLHVDLATLWPYLWAAMPEPNRTDLTAARGNLSKSTTLTAWALLYLPLTWWWWPALPLALGIAFTGWRRTRATANAYAQLLHATTHLHLATLSAHLNHAHTSMPAAAPPE
ncbi:hypothetical protein [Streptomyces chryseus]|uniref:hypothetical protein n=1 Tax=Streptomyces chryseus TaxID=68186 RepID=UPI00110FE65E|nr:hypothetical protein [Streptomyces chryseus]GGX39827.1 hypothetical protein GCM10010353_64020 [Streptomyces chryseus]